MAIKYIFCITTGRSGTGYLSKLFGTLQNCKSYHEQKPLLHGRMMRNYLKGNKKELKSKFIDKIEIINKDKDFLYVDTSHLFIKGFGWELPSFINQKEIGVIILRREKEKVVQSTHRVHSGPFTYLGRKWIIVPRKKNIVSPPIHFYSYTIYRYLLKIFWLFKGEYHLTKNRYPKFFNKLSLQLLEWYYDEVYGMADEYKKRFPKITYVDITLNEINMIDGFDKIIKDFKLEYLYDKNKIINLLATPVNLKEEYS